MTTPDGSHPFEPQDENRSVGDIVGSIAKDLGTLVRQELELAKTEAKDEVIKAGKGAGMLGGAGVAGHLFLIFFSVFLMFVLENWMAFEWASLIVAVIWAIVAGILAMQGRSKLRSVDPKLETTTQTLKEDAKWASNRSKS